MTERCATPGCGRPATSGRWCAACRKRAQRQQAAAAAAEREASVALVDAAEDLLTAARAEFLAAGLALHAIPTGGGSDAAFAEARLRLERAAARLFLARGWSPPPGVQVGQPDLGRMPSDRRFNG